MALTVDQRAVSAETAQIGAVRPTASLAELVIAAGSGSPGFVGRRSLNRRECRADAGFSCMQTRGFGVCVDGLAALNAGRRYLPAATPDALVLRFTGGRYVAT